LKTFDTVTEFYCYTTYAERGVRNAVDIEDIILPFFSFKNLCEIVSSEQVWLMATTPAMADSPLVKNLFFTLLIIKFNFYFD
jgi:hypothetical protein